MNKKPSLFDLASGTTNVSKSYAIRLNHISDLCIVKVDEIIQSGTNEQLYGVTINDDQATEQVFLDLDDCKNNLESIDHTLDSGCIILINEIAYASLRDIMSNILDETDSQIDFNKTTILIKDFILLGHEGELSAMNDSSSELNYMLSDQDIIPPYVINDLKIDHSSSNWTLKCKLTEKGIIQSFINSQNLRNGKKMRIQLFDGVNFIEAVAFDELIEKFERLEIGNIYLVQRGNIRPSKLTFRAWQNQTDNSAYDIIVTPQTKFTHLTNATLKQYNEDKKKIEIDAESESESEKISVSKKIEQVKTIQKKTPEEPSAKSTYNNYDKLDQIQLKKNNTTVNVIGIINTINEVRETTGQYGQTLKMINISLVDKTEATVRVTLWGKEAENFAEHFKIGDCVIFNNIKTNLYEGRISLSKTKDAVLRNASSLFNNPLAVELNQWYSEWKNKKKSNKKKRSITDEGGRHTTQESPMKKLKKK